ncbi:hypothetical protein ACVWY3_000382 [Bradyrhizobium sp. USDA 4486]
MMLQKDQHIRNQTGNDFSRCFNPDPLDTQT